MVYQRDITCEIPSMAYRCKIFEAVNLTLHGHYTHYVEFPKLLA